MMVVMGEMSEICVKLNTERNIVALIANKEIISEKMSFLCTGAFPSRVSDNSENERTPSVANAESQRDKSKTEYGNTSTINVTDIKRFVIGSRAFAKIKRRFEIISISAALTTDKGKAHSEA